MLGLLRIGPIFVSCKTVSVSYNKLLFHKRYSPCSFEAGLFFEVMFKGGFEHGTIRTVSMRKNVELLDGEATFSIEAWHL